MYQIYFRFFFLANLTYCDKKQIKTRLNYTVSNPFRAFLRNRPYLSSTYNKNSSNYGFKSLKLM